MPIVTVRSNLPSASPDFQGKFFEFLKDLLKTPRVIITLEFGKDMTNGGSTNPTILLSLAAVNRLHRDTMPRLHKAIAEFLSTTLNVSLESILIVFSKPACDEVSFAGKPLPEFLARDRDVEFWQD
ncbi:uncharacterized protein LOC101855056 [Aplysia californica]|uniref:Uncharacterized protein LOC101855056 n=1 Tax=Aplysia californica TaxID=6500 RepID=A0ABM0K5P5_APLCA|nr:uncharacterized protein LOC101855056 [Aplysia californica]